MSDVYARSGDYQPGADAWNPPVAALPGVGHMSAPGEDEKEAARVYVAATRATQRLVIGGSEDAVLVKAKCP